MSAQPLRVSTGEFLGEYWQREPMFIPKGIPDFLPPASADELAGLAMEDGVDARIIQLRDGLWTQRLGPFTEADYREKGPWSLLVQSVDHYWREAAALFDAVAFLPRWRFDDILMSYATHGGGAGPHYDNYDVFIVQGEGIRHWELGQRCDDSSPLQDDSDMRILRDFKCRAQFTLETGDVLYIPPGVAHRGTSDGESTSFSIGFRAPRQSDMLARWTDATLERLRADQLYLDPQRSPALRSGEITRDDLRRAHAQLGELLEVHDPGWFGELLTESAPMEPVCESGPEVADDTLWELAPGARLAWYETQTELLVFAAGETVTAPLALRDAVQQLCAGFALSSEAFPPPEGRDVLQRLIGTGTLVAVDTEATNPDGNPEH